MVEQMKNMLEQAKKIYFEDEFKTFMRSIQGFEDTDFINAEPEGIKSVMESKSMNVFEILENSIEAIRKNGWKKEKFPVHSEWHHFLVPGAVMAALRNAGYEIKNKDIEEAIKRGKQFPGGSCGFAGTCGAAYATGIILSLVKKINPSFGEERSETMRAVSDTLVEISKYRKRCCKRSSYIALTKITEMLIKSGFDRITCSNIKCKWSSMNKQCMGKLCPFFKAV